MPFGPDIPVGVDRRHFLKLAASAAAATGLAPGAFGAGTLLGQERPPTATGQEAPPPVPLGNGEPPAFAFQAYPGGTGSLLEKMWREGGGSPFE
ncbi:MAG: twin-arginine translocation signal domain-containing protein, partial [Longimicrobiales bacterium]|nr:twin-arginine translocation signal domain-containing protein [Longimicrobiales bacterium]